MGCFFLGILGSESMKRFLTKRTLFFGGVYALFFLWSLYTLDPDFGWHLRAGQYFLSNGVPASDIFTYTASSFPWVDHEWLSDIFVALVYQLGSFWLLAAIYAGMWTTAVALVSKKVPYAIIIVGVIAIMPFRTHLDEPPENHATRGSRSASRSRFSGPAQELRFAKSGEAEDRIEATS